MKTQHTPGPWYTNGDFVWFKDPTTCDGATVAVAMETVTPNSGIGRDEMHANARLIAAVPKLLAAIEGIIRQHDEDTDNYSEVMRDARVAYAEATE